METIFWTIDPSLKEELSTHYKSKLARDFMERSPKEIINEFTFDDDASVLSLSEAESFLSYVRKGFLHGALKGIGLEVGSGPGTWSALIARIPEVKKVYAMDACEDIVALTPRVVDHLLPTEQGKVIPCVGEFNNIELPDASLDFVFDFFSLHHSSDLPRTMKEIARVLKPGGALVCFDKARSDALTDNDLDTLLEKEYGEAMKKKMGIAEGVRHTRRMNGEYEYRLSSWRDACLSNDFSSFEHFNIARTVNSNPRVAFFKRMFANLPPRLQALITKFFVPVHKKGMTISADHRVYSPLVERFPKEISLMIGWK